MAHKLFRLSRQKHVMIRLISLILITLLIYSQSGYIWNKTDRPTYDYKSVNMWEFNKTCETTEKPVSQTVKEIPLNIFYFALTHHSNRKKLLASHRTWARTVPNVHWYSDKPDPEVDVTVLAYPEGNSYNDISFRSLMVFHHVLEHHSGYDWYVRLWDDNYLFGDRLERLLRTQNPNDSILIGKVLGYNHTVTYKDNRTLDKHFIYPGGGSGWVLSRAAFQKWASNHKNNNLKHKACSLDGLKQYMHYVIPSYSAAEDLMFAQCLLSQGVSFIHAFGFQNWYVTHPELLMTLQEAADGKMTSLESPGREEESLIWCGLVKCINFPNCYGVITLHYVKPADMYTLHKMVQNQNDNTLYKYNK